MEYSQTKREEDLHKISTCCLYSTANMESSIKTSVKFDSNNSSSHHRNDHEASQLSSEIVEGRRRVVSCNQRRVMMRRNRSPVLLNLEISATPNTPLSFLVAPLVMLILLQMPEQSHCVMTPATSSSSTTNTPLSLSSSSSQPASGDGSYSLFPHEDLRTGKKIRFDDDRGDRSLYRERDRYRSSYPVVFDERYSAGGQYYGRGDYVRGTAVGVGSSSSYPSSHRPYSQYDDRNYNFQNDPVRTRGSRVYFEDGDDRGRFPTPFYYEPNDRYRSGDDERYYRPTLLPKPLSPIGSLNNRPLAGSNRYLPEVFPGPSLSKLPVGATIGRSRYDRPALGPYRLHSFNPITNSFGSPRNRLGGFSETEAPGPDLFLNHEQYLEYHRKVALARDEEFRKVQKALQEKDKAATEHSSVSDPKKLLFSSKQPFEIGGLSPPPRDGKSTSSSSRPEGGSSGSPSSTASSSTNNDNNNDIGSLLSSPVEESSLSGSGSSSNDKTIGQVSLFSASDARVPLLTGRGHEKEEGSSNDNRGVVHIHGNDPGGVFLATSTTRSNSESETRNTKGSGSSVGEAVGDPKKKNVEAEEESENAKSQVTQIPPNFISKSGRQLAYHHIQQPSIHQVGNSNEGGGRRSSTSSSTTTYRTTTSKSSISTSALPFNTAKATTTSGSSGKITERRNNEQEGTDFELNNARKSSKNEFKTSGSSTGRIGHALPLVQKTSNKGSNDNDDFFIPNQPDFQIPVRIESSSSSGGVTTASTVVPVSKSKGEKSGLGTEVTKNRIKSNAAAKIAIIRQQELKQIQKERLANIRSYEDANGGDSLNSVYVKPSPTLGDDELSKLTKYNTNIVHIFPSNNPTRITDTDIKNVRQLSAISSATPPAASTNFSTSTSTLPGRPASVVYKSTYKFPVLSNKPTPAAIPAIVPKKNITPVISVETDAVEKLLLKDSKDPFKKRDSILENNDIVANTNAKETEKRSQDDDGHFTLINLHNDRVKIVQDFEEPSNSNNPPEVEEPRPLSQSYMSSPSFSDLDHGEDELLFLGSNDDTLVVNKTLPGMTISSKSSGDRRSQQSNTTPSSSSTAASTNFIRVVRVKSSPELRSLSPVLNINIAATSSSPANNSSRLISTSISNKTNDSLIPLPFYIQRPNNLIVSRQNLSSINNNKKTSSTTFLNAANNPFDVATLLIAGGASINKSAGNGATSTSSSNDINVSTAEKTLSLFMAKRNNISMNNSKLDRMLKLKNDEEHHHHHSYSSGFNVTSSSYYATAAAAATSKRKYRKKESYGGINGKFGSKSVVIETDLGNKIGNGSQSSSSSSPSGNSQETTNKAKVKQSGGGVGRPRGVVSRVHAHVSHCPKLKAPAEIICDIHIRERHDHPNPQLTVGWRRKYYNATQPDVLLVLNRTQAYDEEFDEEDEGTENNSNGWANIDLRNSSDLISAGKSLLKESAKDTNTASMQDFHDKFNVTLAPGISPMLRSVLLIRGVTAPDCGNYQCEVSDGVNTLTSETLLFLCH